MLVTSCDGYHDVEGPFIELWHRNWPDCPFETVLVSETLSSPGFDRVILTGRGKTWCQMLAEALEQISSPFVLMLMNDYFLEGKVDTSLFLKRLDEARRYDAANLRLMPKPPGRKAWLDTDLMEMPKDTAYCVTCQAGIWNREYLLSLARRNKSAWEFERYGSYMVGDEPRPLLTTRSQEFPFVDAVHKGCWERPALELLRKYGVEYDGGRRLPGLKQRFVEGVKTAIFAIFPLNLIVRVQNIFNAGKK